MVDWVELMQQSAEKQGQSKIRYPNLPLAVYREIAAHLRQVPGIQTGLYPQQSSQFDYNQSQVESLWIQYPENADPAVHQRVTEILTYYSNRYSPYQEDE